MIKFDEKMRRMFRRSKQRIHRQVQRMGQNASDNVFMLMALCCTAITSCLFVVAVASGLPWDITHYDHKLILMHISDENRKSNVYYLDVINSSSASQPNAPPPLAILWDLRGTHAKCGGRNGTVIADEENSPWGTCRQIDERIFKTVEKPRICGRQARCIRMYDEYELDNEAFEKYCCLGCCPYSIRHRRDLALDSQTLHQPMYTTVSCLIVSGILQLITYLELLFMAINGNVTLAMMSGVTTGISGLYVGFAVTINHYKMYLISTVHRSLGQMPHQVSLSAQSRTGAGTYVAWMTAVANLLLCVVWIVHSKQLVQKEHTKAQEMLGRIPEPQADRHTSNTNKFGVRKITQQIHGMRNRVSSASTRAVRRMSTTINPSGTALVPEITINNHIAH